MVDKHDNRAEATKIYETYPKLTIVLNFRNKDNAMNQALTQAFEEVYRRNTASLSVLI